MLEKCVIKMQQHLHSWIKKQKDFAKSLSDAAEKAPDKAVDLI